MAARNTAETVFIGDASELLGAYQQIREANRKQDAELKELKRASAEAHREEKQGLSEAARMLREVQTPLERYRDRVKDIEKAYESGAIDQETYNRQLAKQRQLLDDGSKSTGILDGAFGRLLPTVGSLAAVFANAAREQAKLREESEQTAASIDKMSRKFQVQAGLSNLQARDARQGILETARSNAVSEETAFSAATQLVSSGFSSPEKSGALDAFLKITASSNLAQQDPQALIQGMGQFLAGFGSEKSGQNLMDLGVRTRGLFTETDVQVADLSDVAKAAPTFAQAGVSVEDTLSAFAILRERLSAPEAATQQRNVLSSMQTFAADQGKAAVLKDTLGLGTNQVDVVGESFPDALRTLKTAIDGLKEEQKAPAIAKLFGRENAVGALGLLNNVDDFDKMAKLQNDRAGFVQGVNVNQSGPNAAANRLSIDRTMMLLQEEDAANARAVGKQQLRNEYAENYQASGMMGDFAVGLAQAGAETAMFVGASPENFISPEGKQQMQSAQQSDFSVDQLVDAMKENTDEVRLMRQEAASARDRPQPVAVEGGVRESPEAAQGRR